jgi:hypothetical protein
MFVRCVIRFADSVREFIHSWDFTLTRRQHLLALATTVSGAAFASGQTEAAEQGLSQRPAGCPIDKTTALIFSEEAPLRPATGLHDAQAVWCRVPERPANSVLVFLHGHNGYVTVDATGRSRVPDWARSNKAASDGASSKQAAPLVYRLDRLAEHHVPNEPVILVPEVSTLASGSFWAKEPAGQYADPSRLGRMVTDCFQQLTGLKRSDGLTYLRSDKQPNETLPPVPQNRPLAINRVILAGHSGAGLPLEEAARSSLLLPGRGAPAELWLFDCTYWSKVGGFVEFCQQWHAATRLNGARSDSARFVCAYRPKTSTEMIADSLRIEIAKAIGVSADSLISDHTGENLTSVVLPALRKSGVLFIRTHLDHDEIPTVFIPELLRAAAS